MNKTEKITAVNNCCTWAIRFPAIKEATIQQKLETFKDIDSVLIFLKNEKKYWLSRESGGVADKVKKYSVLCNEAIDVIEVAINGIEAPDFLPNIIFNRVLSEAGKHGIRAESSQSRSPAGTMIQQITIEIKTLCSQNTNPDGISYAYKELYIKGRTSEFHYFASMALGQKNVIDCLTTGTQLSSAVRFIGYMQEGHKYPTLQESALEIEKDLLNRLDTLSAELGSRRSEVACFMDESDARLDKTESDVRDKIDKTELDFRKWYEDQVEEIKRLKVTYEEKLHLEEPAEHWKRKAKEQEDRAKKFLAYSALLCLVIVGIAALILGAYVLFSDSGSINFLPYSLLSAGVIAFMLYLIRTTIKIMLSAKHLQIEYEGKSAFTYFYLSLLRGGEKIDEQTRLLIYSTLFGKVDTGLVTQPDSDMGSLTALLALLGNK